MNNKSYIDPILFGFFDDENLEIAERTGIALKEAAKYCPITFGDRVMPTVRLWGDVAVGNFNFASSIGFWLGNAENLIKKYPEGEAEIRALIKKAQKYDRLKNISAKTTDGERVLMDGSAGGGEGWGGHSNPDFGRIIDLGTEGIREMIAKYKEINTEDTDWFYRGCEYTLDALDILGDRFLTLAKELYEKCDDAEDKKRYAAAVKAFEVVPRKPAYDFTSACMVFLMVYTFDGIDSPGRFDQYMIRPYRASADKEEAIDILDRLWDVFHSVRAWNLCLSGSDENWNDDTNELTYEVLKMAAKKKYQTPNITLRIHRNTPEKLWDAAVETLSSGIGMPALYNDEVVCPALEKIGIPPHHSHLYCMNGCNQIDIMGKSHMGLEDGEVSLAKVLEFTLLNGESFNRRAFSFKSGDASKFESFDELWQAFDSQLQYVIHFVCQGANNFQQRRAAYTPNPLRSCLIEGCLEKGRDYRNGGPLYGHGQILAETVADCGDSLWAIKKKVFIEKKYTMEEIVTALKADFEGYEEMRHELASCEKFGNDVPECDEMTTKATNRFFELLKRHRTYRGGIFTGGCSTFCRAADYGRRLGALPNGHRGAEPLVADSIAATPGCDTHGPTALIKSVLGYNHTDSCSGFVFQIKFDKKVFATEKGRETFKALAKSYFAGGGQQYTATVVSAEDLLDAKVNPDAHRDLIVRVGGYSAYFVLLEEGLQDNIIARTFQEV